MKKSKLLGIFVITAFATFGVLFFAPHKALAATFTVDSTADDADSSAGDGNCDNGSGSCTLRAAIQEANAFGGADTINFNIAGAGVHTFTPASGYDNLTTQITIDGTTQPGASCGTLVPTNLPGTNTPHDLKIELDFSGAVFTDGITASGFSANGSIIKGLIINGLPDGAPVALDSAASNITVECNYLGTDAAGTSAGSGSSNTINIDGGDSDTIQNNLIAGGANGIGGSANLITIRNNLIGTNATGTSSLPNSGRGLYMNGLSQALVSHNVIAGNTGDGMYATGDNFTISGNYFGIGVTGNSLGNGGDGLKIYSSNTYTIGGTTENARNVFSANVGDGLHVYSDCGSGNVYDSVVFGNYVGTDTSGNVASGFGNQKAGIEVNEYQGSCGSVYRHQIGGDNNGEANIIAGNNEQGILIHQDINHDVFSIAVLHNKIFGNGQIGIDLAADSSSDAIADTDLGPNPINELPVTYPSTNGNNYLNRPTVNSTSYSSGKITVNYSFHANLVNNSDDGVSLLAADLVGYRLDFYLNDSSTDGAFPGYAQGQTHLGSFIVDGSATGATHSFDLASFTSGQTVTATATLLWTKTPGDATTPQGCNGTVERAGNGPPYTYLNSCPE